MAMKCTPVKKRLEINRDLAIASTANVKCPTFKKILF